jgi:ABC-type branched-subunit amino acid transport system ATPase component
MAEDRKIGDVILDVKNISLRFGGVKALTDISFNVREHEVRAIIGPNGAGKSSMLNCINGVYTPQEGSITFRGKTFDHMNSRQVAEMGVARTFQNLALFKGMNVIDNIMSGRNLKMKTNLFQQAFAGARRSARRSSTAPSSSASSTSSRSRPTARRRWAACPTACRSASTWAARWPWSRRCCCWTNRWPA